ncbi:hypothetical protein N7475_004123 [Penicillium sp. IBT 31633x]|nr:hypothetical protein N7475_004123 [Penicillium sp. IBT 31633x]
MSPAPMRPLAASEESVYYAKLLSVEEGYYAQCFLSAFLDRTPKSPVAFCLSLLPPVSLELLRTQSAAGSTHLWRIIRSMSLLVAG